MSDLAGYAPLDIERDTLAAEARFGLVGTRVEASWGSAFARHPPTRAGEIATVMLHGASGSATGWTPLLETARRHGCPILEPVLIDLPGWGDGHLTASATGVTADQISDLVRAVIDQLGYRKCRLVGHSMGGLIALHLASVAPELVTRVGVVSPTSFAIIRSVEHPVREFRSVPAFTMLWRVMAALRVLGGTGRALVRGAGALGLMRVVFAPLFAHGFRMPASVVLATVDGIDPHAFLTAAEVVRGYDARALWSKISCPVDAVAGDRDVFVGADDLAELQRTIPQALVTVVPECGHFGLVEWPLRVLTGLGFTCAAIEHRPHGHDT